MEPVLHRLGSMQFTYGDGDSSARSVLHQRLAETARKKKLITYSTLIEGVTFQLPNVAHGEPFQLAVQGWSDLDRAIIGSFLGRISADSYREGGFFASALAVSGITHEPSEGFRALMKEVGVLVSSKRDDFILLWSSQVKKAYEWYAMNEP